MNICMFVCTVYCTWYCVNCVYDTTVHNYNSQKLSSSYYGTVHLYPYPTMICDVQFQNMLSRQQQLQVPTEFDLQRIPAVQPATRTHVACSLSHNSPLGNLGLIGLPLQ